MHTTNSEIQFLLINQNVQSKLSLHTDSIGRNQNIFSYTNFLQHSSIYTKFITELVETQMQKSKHKL